MLSALLFAVVSLGLLWPLAPAAATLLPWPALQLDIARLDQPAAGWSASGLRFDYQPDSGAARLQIQRLQIAGQTLSRVRLDCPRLQYHPRQWACPQGGRLQLTVAGSASPLSLPLQWRYQPDRQAWQIQLELTAQSTLLLAGDRHGGHGHFASLSVPALMQLLTALRAPAAPEWGAQGQLSGKFSWQGQGANFALQLQHGAFSAADGMHAAEQLAISWQGEVAASKTNKSHWDWSLTALWEQGGVFWAPWYLAAEGQQLSARGHLEADALVVAEARLALGALGQGHFAGQWPRHAASPAAAQGRFTLQNLDLGGVYQVLLAPLLAQQGAPEFIAAGQASLELQLANGRLDRLQVDLSGAGLQELRGRYGLNGVDGRVHWSAAGELASTLRVGEARFGALRFDPFVLPLRLGPQGLYSERIDAALLDSKLIIEQLHVDWSDPASVDWGFGLALHPLSLARLAQPLGLPAFGGSLSASIPRIHHRNKQVRLEGSLVIQAFDGYFAVDRLRIDDPLGHLPRLHADVDLRHIDLEQLTTAFAFGRITGFIDGEIRDLQLARWQPQAFAARVYSSPGDYPRRISQRAVENISALGGASAAAAIQRSFLRFFETFGYQRIGLACTLRQGVCQMRGLEDGVPGEPRGEPLSAGGGYVIVEGGGIPALNVIGYNRHVDWPVLVERLQRITDRNTIPEIR